MGRFGADEVTPFKSMLSQKVEDYLLKSRIK